MEAKTKALGGVPLPLADYRVETTPRPLLVLQGVDRAKWTAAAYPVVQFP